MSYKSQFRDAALNALKPFHLGSVSEQIATYMTAQASLESANFTSNVFVKNNNAIGMKMPSVRQTVYISRPGSSAQADGGGNYAYYKTVSDCAFDLVEWLKYNHADFSVFTSLRSYTDFLGSHGYYGISKDEYFSRTNKYVGEVESLAGNTLSSVPQALKLGVTCLAAFVVYHLISKS